MSMKKKKVTKKKITKKPSFEMIPCIDASDMPSEVRDWCDSNDISTHYYNSIAMCWDKDNIFTKWVESLGVQPEWYQIGDEKRKKWIVAIIAT